MCTKPPPGCMGHQQPHRGGAEVPPSSVRDTQLLQHHVSSGHSQPPTNPQQEKNTPQGCTDTKGVLVCQSMGTAPGWVQAPHRRVLCPGWREFAMLVATSHNVKPCPAAPFFSPPSTFTKCHASFARLFKLTFASEDSNSLVTTQSSWWSSFPLVQ